MFYCTKLFNELYLFNSMPELGYIKSWSCTDGRITSLGFIWGEGELYLAEITPEKIELLKIQDRFYSNQGKHIARYDQKTQNIEWYLSHCCGLQGFGQEQDDICHACHTPDSRIRETPENMSIIKSNGNYDPAISSSIFKGIIRVCQGLETKIRDYTYL